MTSLIEQDLEKSIKNRELNKLLKMEKMFSIFYYINKSKRNSVSKTS